MAHCGVQCVSKLLSFIGKVRKIIIIVIVVVVVVVFVVVVVVTLN